MSIFEFTDYKAYVRQVISEKPGGGRGEFRQMALKLGVSSTMISQVFSGDKHLNHELAAHLSDHLGLNEAQEDYFFLLLDLQRAGSEHLRRKLQRRVHEQQMRARKISERVAKSKELSGEEKAVYYSSWMFTGVRNLIACDGARGVRELAAELKLEESQVQAVIRFLLDKGLLEENGGRLNVLSKATHLEGENPLVVKHHQNWRLRAMQKMDWQNEQDLFYTGPMSLSRVDTARVREMLLELVQNTNKIVVDSPSEDVRCLNLDWFKY